MKLKQLWIDRFKNLRDFGISFDKNLTTVILGGNGTGKSNLLEALAIIFRDLDLGEYRRTPFEYYLVYQCHGHLVEIDANPSQNRPSRLSQLSLMQDGSEEPRRRGRLLIKVDHKSVAMNHFFENKKDYLPRHVFGYYSGPTNRLAQHFQPHQRIFYEEQRRGENSPLRPLFFALPVHSQLVLLAYFSFPGPEEKKFLEEYLNIVSLESVLFIIKEPNWARATYPKDLFWGAEGVPKRFLQELYNEALAPVRETVKVSIRTGKTADEEHLYLYIRDGETLKRIAQKWGDNREFFKALDTLLIADLIAEVRIRVHKKDVEGDITFGELSEGEQQLLTVLGLLKFTRDTESLFLLDEPDTHLNPAWKVKYMRLLEPIIGIDAQSQILLVTHDPLVIFSSLKEQVRVLTFEGGNNIGKTSWFEPTKDPRGLRVEALLTSDVYGLRSALDYETQDKLDRKRELTARRIDGEALTTGEEEELARLSEELDQLGFTHTIRDPLYGLFVEAMSEEREKYPELRNPVLSKEERNLQAKLAREIAGRLLTKSREDS
jgi:predicted ATPase